MTDDIRPAVEADRPTLAQIWYDGWRQGHLDHVPEELIAQRGLDQFSIRLKPLLPVTVVMGPVGAPLGFCIHKEDEIYQMYVDAKAQGSGIAGKLIAAAEARIAVAGHKAAHLSVIPQNTRAIRFYEKMGWQKTRVEDVSVDTLAGPYVLPCLVMTKQL